MDNMKKIEYSQIVRRKLKELRIDLQKSMEMKKLPPYFLLSHQLLIIYSNLKNVVSIYHAYMISKQTTGISIQITTTLSIE